MGTHLKQASIHLFLLGIFITNLISPNLVESSRLLERTIVDEILREQRHPWLDKTGGGRVAAVYTMKEHHVERDSDRRLQQQHDQVSPSSSSWPMVESYAKGFTSRDHHGAHGRLNRVPCGPNPISNELPSGYAKNLHRSPPSNKAHRHLLMLFSTHI